MKNQIVEYISPTIQQPLNSQLQSRVIPQVYTVPIGRKQPYQSVQAHHSSQFAPISQQHQYSQFAPIPQQFTQTHNQLAYPQQLPLHQANQITLSPSEYKLRMEQLISQVDVLSKIINDNQLSNQSLKQELIHLQKLILEKQQSINNQGIQIVKLQSQPNTMKQEFNSPLPEEGQQQKESISFEKKLFYENLIRQNYVEIGELELKNAQMNQLPESNEKLQLNQKAKSQVQSENKRNFSSDKIQNQFISRQF